MMTSPLKQIDQFSGGYVYQGLCERLLNDDSRLRLRTAAETLMRQDATAILLLKATDETHHEGTKTQKGRGFNFLSDFVPSWL
jgi:hypothetical protein